jgi:type III pantothenate kinase
MTTVLVDVGNTRIKWATLAAGKLVRSGSAVHRGALDAGVAALAAELPPRVRIVAANVAGPGMAERLQALVATRPGSSLELVRTASEQFGVRCAYADPSRLGVDRWIAVLAAYHAARGAACAISAGTAVTFDAVDAAGVHLGGLIFPSTRLSAAALDRNTSDIGSTAPAPAVAHGLELLGRSTDAAVGHAAWLALSAALDRAVATVERALGARPAVYLTGGDAQVLRGWLETRVELRADLVLEGLKLFADAAES